MMAAPKIMAAVQQSTTGMRIAAAALPVEISCICASPRTAHTRPQTAAMAPPQNGMTPRGALLPCEYASVRRRGLEAEPRAAQEQQHEVYDAAADEQAEQHYDATDNQRRQQSAAVPVAPDATQPDQLPHRLRDDRKERPHQVIRDRCTQAALAADVAERVGGIEEHALGGVDVALDRRTALLPRGSRARAGRRRWRDRWRREGAGRNAEVGHRMGSCPGPGGHIDLPDVGNAPRLSHRSCTPATWIDRSALEPPRIATPFMRRQRCDARTRVL